MKSVLKLYREWDERRWPKWAERWGHKRAKGKSHYVRWAACAWGGSMVNFFVLWDYLSGAGVGFVRFVITLLVCLAGGWVVGASGWSSNERRYQKYLDGGGRRRLRQ